MPLKCPTRREVSDEEWSLAGPYQTLVEEAAPHRSHGLCEVFNALRWLFRAGTPWSLLPNNIPPWKVVYQENRRWGGS